MVLVSLFPPPPESREPPASEQHRASRDATNTTNATRSATRTNGGKMNDQDQKRGGGGTRACSPLSRDQKTVPRVALLPGRFFESRVASGIGAASAASAAVRTRLISRRPRPRPHPPWVSFAVPPLSRRKCLVVLIPAGVFFVFVFCISGEGVGSTVPDLSNSAGDDLPDSGTPDFLHGAPDLHNGAPHLPPAWGRCVAAHTHAHAHTRGRVVSASLLLRAARAGSRGYARAAAASLRIALAPVSGARG